jgi:hypothetical protein
MGRTRTNRASKRVKSGPEPTSNVVINRKIEAICELLAVQIEQYPNQPLNIKQAARQYDVPYQRLNAR